MKAKNIFMAIMASAMLFTSCSDKIYEEINTDPTKADRINPASQLTQAELMIFGDMEVADMHRCYTYAFTQQLMGCWNTTYYGGVNRQDDEYVSRLWNHMYLNAIRNLVDGINSTKDDPAQANLNAALRIFRVFCSSLITDSYGDCPYSEAGLGFLEGVNNPKYDTQESIYKSFFTELKACVDQISNDGGNITSDPMFNGNINSWKLFANSLRLRYAMRISDVEPELAKTEFTAALADGVFASAADEALVKHLGVSFSFGPEAYSDYRGNALSKYFYGNDPSENTSYICSTFWKQLKGSNDPRLNIYCRFFIDDFMSVLSPDGRVDVTNEMMLPESEGMIMSIIPGDFMWDVWFSDLPADGSALANKLAEVKAAHPTYSPDGNPRWHYAKLPHMFMKSDNPGVIMTYAEVLFLEAEAASKGWIAEDGKALYEAGIRAAMDFVTSHYDFAAISDADFSAYIAQPNVAWGGDAENQRKLINTQAWILHFNNPYECWANVRRADYPALDNPSPTKNELINGADIPVRMPYPRSEDQYNKNNCDEAKGRVAGYSWNARLWWDVK